MKICVIGGGINGLCCAWVLSKQGYQVDLFDQGVLVGKTSRSSSKLLHGGLRYLEHGSFRLVKEALKERDDWLKRVPALTSPLRLVLPVYKGSRRSRWMIKVGLFLYDNLFKSSVLPKSKWLSSDELLKQNPQLKSEGLKGGYEFSDGQMDDYKLGLWVAEQAKKEGCHVFENTKIEKIDQDGKVFLSDETKQYDRVINAGGPWAVELLKNSGINSPTKLDAIRGSHLIVDKKCKQAYLFEVPNEKRIFFVLPWKGNTLVGTTEVRQSLDDPIECSDSERDYLLDSYNYYHTEKIERSSIVESFSGVRPLLYSATNPGDTTREYEIYRTGKLINIFGGKWTTALALAHKVSDQYVMD